VRDDDEFNEPYLPERYKEIVRKKKQRRLLKKIGMIAAGIVALIVVYILLSGFLGGSPQPAPVPTLLPTPTLTLPETTAVPATTAAIATAIPVKTAIPTTVITTTKPVPIATEIATETPEPVLTARANTYVTPKGGDPKITEKQAAAIALVAFPNLPSGKMSVELATDPIFGQVWKYVLLAGTTTEASGLISAETGSVVTYNRTIHPGARPQNPVLTMGNARQIADSTMNDRNTGILSVNMSDSRYVPLSTPGGNVAGTYRFVFNRVIQDYPCDTDGFIVSVDAVSGAVTEWVQRWESPDNAFMILDTPTVPKYDAIYAAQAKAKTIYPGSIGSLQIVSAERVWKDEHAPGTTPRPSSIPLAWKIVFDDETIRGHPEARKGVCWVDTFTGEIIEITYQH
jgi:predicted nucleic acid-binding Zn ribbon protein